MTNNRQDELPKVTVGKSRIQLKAKIEDQFTKSKLNNKANHQKQKKNNIDATPYGT